LRHYAWDAARGRYNVRVIMSDGLIEMLSIKPEHLRVWVW
jgi:hypothetical protein